MPNNNEQSLQVNNSTLQTADQKKLANALRTRINLLKKELVEIETANIDLDGKFNDFTRQFTYGKDVVVFSFRDFRKALHKYIKDVKTYTVAEIYDKLREYSKEYDMFLYPSNKPQAYYRGRIQIKYKDSGEFACIMGRRGSEPLQHLYNQLKEDAELTINN